MILYPERIELLASCIVFAVVFETLRVVIGYLSALPSSFRKSSLEIEKIKTQADLASIKSVQLELVRSSKLERQVIKLDKELVKLKEGQDGLKGRFKNVSRVLRAVFIVAAGIYLENSSTLQISPKVLWPFSWLGSDPTMGIHPWFVLIVSCMALRHIYRSLLPVLFPNSAFP